MPFHYMFNWLFCKQGYPFNLHLFSRLHCKNSIRFDPEWAKKETDTYDWYIYELVHFCADALYRVCMFIALQSTKRTVTETTKHFECRSMLYSFTLEHEIRTPFGAHSGIINSMGFTVLSTWYLNFPVKRSRVIGYFAYRWHFQRHSFNWRTLIQRHWRFFLFLLLLVLVLMLLSYRPMQMCCAHSWIEFKHTFNCIPIASSLYVK